MLLNQLRAASDVFMPIGGKVVEVNEELIDDPALLNSDPYENWMIKIEIKDKG